MGTLDASYFRMPGGKMPGTQYVDSLINPESTLAHLDYVTHLIGFDHVARAEGRHDAEFLGRLPDRARRRQLTLVQRTTRQSPGARVVALGTPLLQQVPAFPVRAFP